MTRDDAPASSAEAPSKEKTAPEPKAPAGPEFDQAVLPEWAASAEDAIAKRLGGTRPKTAPLADNALFLWAITRLVRRQLHLNERGKLLQEEFPKDLVSTTPIPSREVADGLAWLFMLTHKDLPAWKASLASKLRFAGFMLLCQMGWLPQALFNGKFFTFFYPSNLAKVFAWLATPFNGLHVLLGVGCLALSIRGAEKLGRESLGQQRHRMACMMARTALLSRMGARAQWRHSFRSELGCWLTLAYVVAGLALSLATGAATFSVGVLAYGNQYAWPVWMWTLMAWFFVFVATLSWLFDTEMTRKNANEKGFDWLVEVVDEWRQHPDEDAPKPANAEAA